MQPEELLTHLENEIGAFVDGSSGNWIAMRQALSPTSAGLKMFERPLIAVGDAHDSMFVDLQAPEAVGQQMRLPDDWLEGACSVISYFLPMSEQVRASNRGDGPASPEWFHARIDGQMFIMRLGEHVQRLLAAAGYRSVCPACHPDMKVAFKEDDPVVAYRSNWSERHVAYVCGLGTFSLSKGIITEKGMAGRLGSVVTDAPLPVTTRAYTDLYEYCINCGACADRCPANAISLETGKDHYACHNELLESKKYFPGYLGCGKCQVGVPCECARP